MKKKFEYYGAFQSTLLSYFKAAYDANIEIEGIKFNGVVAKEDMYIIYFSYDHPIQLISMGRLLHTYDLVK